MGLSLDGQNAAADGVAAVYDYLALYDGDPEVAGSEITGGSYARQLVTFAAASGGQKAGSGSPVASFSVPGGNTVSHWALFDSLTVGVRGAAGAFAGSEVFGSDGTYNVNTLILDPTAT